VRIKKQLLTIAGFTCLGLGGVGAALPVMPTTPFILLAALCFSCSNENLYDRLRKNRVFGPFIENYRTKQGISILHKAASIAFVWVGLSISMIMVHATWAYVLLPCVGAGVTIHLLMIKTRGK